MICIGENLRVSCLMNTMSGVAHLNQAPTTFIE